MSASSDWDSASFGRIPSCVGTPKERAAATMRLATRLARLSNVASATKPISKAHLAGKQMYHRLVDLRIASAQVEERAAAESLDLYRAERLGRLRARPPVDHAAVAKTVSRAEKHVEKLAAVVPARGQADGP